MGSGGVVATPSFQLDTKPNRISPIGLCLIFQVKIVTNPIATLGGVMKIESITVENFRSITSAKRIPLSRYTAMVGPNNEGKSNILKALNLAMTTLQRWKPRRSMNSDGKFSLIPPDKRHRSYESGYNWTRDYPINLQNSKSTKKCTDVTIEFKLDDSEVVAFVAAVGSNLNGTLPIKISYNRDDFDISISKPGKGHATLNKKTTRIAAFVSQRLRFDYVPAVRTAGSAEEVVKKLVANELQYLETDDRYVQAMNVIDEIQAPILDELSRSITNTVSSFLPSVKGVTLRASQSSRLDVLRRTIQIEVDDGVQTDIGQKGDGVQSLVALALMRHASETQSSKFNSIIAIEEPESHLHPKAIRDLRDVIVKLSETSQVVVSSHSPLLVRWGGDTSTIIVGGSRAVVAKKISDVRDSLGVMVADNLSSVEFALLVEGECDRRIIQRLIELKGSKGLNGLFAENRFRIYVLGGVGKVSYSVNSFENNILGFHVFVDNDASAVAEIKSAIDKKIIKENEYNVCSCIGMKESEIEDCVNPAIYRKFILDKYGVDIDHKSFGGNAKWSMRMRGCFGNFGKIWSDKTENEIKIEIAETFETKTIGDALIEEKSSSLFALLNVLEEIGNKVSA